MDIERRGFIGRVIGACTAAVAGLFVTKAKADEVLVEGVDYAITPWQPAMSHMLKNAGVPADGRFVFRVGDRCAAAPIPWEHQRPGDVMLQLDFTKGSIEQIEAYRATSEPDTSDMEAQPIGVDDRIPLFDSAKHFPFAAGLIRDGEAYRAMEAARIMREHGLYPVKVHPQHNAYQADSPWTVMQQDAWCGFNFAHREGGEIPPGEKCWHDDPIEALILAEPRYLKWKAEHARVIPTSIG